MAGMPEVAYAAARRAAPRIRAHFEAQASQHRSPDSRPLLPDEDVIAQLIDAAFWTSLQREELYTPRVSLAFVPPDRAEHALRFAAPLPLEPMTLAKVAPAVERPGMHLGVSRAGDRLEVWGATRHIPTLALVVEVAAPGLLVVKHHRGGRRGKFVNVAVLEGGAVRVVDEHALSLPDCPGLLASLLGFETRESGGAVNVLVQLAVSMRAHRRGGLLVLVPDRTGGWQESVVQPLRYVTEPGAQELAHLMRREAWARDGAWHEAVAHVVDAVAGLTAVDGATIMSRAYEVLAFGAKITRRRGAAPVGQVTVTEPIEGGEAAVVDPALLGGTRHLAAAQIVHDQHDATALVASQDGRFTVIAWSPTEGMVHAHRVEALLL